jgi:hypothetical protein
MDMGSVLKLKKAVATLSAEKAKIQERRAVRADKDAEVD